MTSAIPASICSRSAAVELWGIALTKSGDVAEFDHVAATSDWKVIQPGWPPRAATGRPLGRHRRYPGSRGGASTGLAPARRPASSGEIRRGVLDRKSTRL